MKFWRLKFEVYVLIIVNFSSLVGVEIISKDVCVCFVYDKVFNEFYENKRLSCGGKFNLLISS